MQCRKLLPHQAQRIAAQHAASVAVGSPFTRELKRLCGRMSVSEAQRMRQNFAIPPAREVSGFVSSH